MLAAKSFACTLHVGSFSSDSFPFLIKINSNLKFIFLFKFTGLEILRLFQRERCRIEDGELQNQETDNLLFPRRPLNLDL